MSAQSPPPHNSQPQFNEAIRMMQEFAALLENSVQTVGTAAVELSFPIIEQSVEWVGHWIAPIADIPFIKVATGIPGVSWLLAALGQVNADKVHNSVADLRRQYPLESDEQLAHRAIVETTWRAAQVGLLTNVIPPVAAALFAIDIGAIAALQANMIYRIAAIYGFSAEDPARRGEVLAIWGIATGSSTAMKSGLSLVEILPAIGAAIGIASDAAILYGVGFLASRYYATKQARQFQPNESVL